MTRNAGGHRIVKCWACGAEAPGGDVCRECGRLQSFPAGGDHWSVLGLPRRLVLDGADLETRFHGLNRTFHPDYFRLRTPAEQAISLENSAAVNTAYRALRDPVTRVEYLLETEGAAQGSAGPSRPPADLLERILDLQEARQELAGASGDEAAALRARLEVAQRELEARRAWTESELATLLPQWDAADDAGRRGVLGQLRDILATRAYLKRVLRDLSATLGDGSEGRKD